MWHHQAFGMHQVQPVSGMVTRIAVPRFGLEDLANLQKAKRGEKWFDAIAGSAVVSRLGARLTRHRLRILAYHGISNIRGFAQQIDMLRREFRPVGAEEILDALENRSKLPEHAVWITFDDGDPSVIDEALPVLDRHRVPSTMFVCPGLVDTDQPYWWQVVKRFQAEGFPYPPSLSVQGEAEALAHLKSVSDAERRAIVEALASTMSTAGRTPRRRQVSTQELQRYVDSGGTVANHTWDHPCLNRCTPDEQLRQIVEAHNWLQAKFPSQPQIFAYPNGDWASEAEAALKSLGYRAAVRFDHRLADPQRQSPFQLSRLRTNSELTLNRYRAIASGVHPLVHRSRLGVSRLLPLRPPD